MGSAYFIQTSSVHLVGSSRPQPISKMRLPAGSYVIIAKFNVAASWIPDERPKISRFTLSFRGVEDISYCDLREPGELKTVVLTLAGGSLTGEDIGLGRVRPAFANLVCNQSPSDIEVKLLSMTAISVDSIEPPLP